MAQDWLRLYRAAVNNPKIQRLGLDAVGFWANCLCLSDDDGRLPKLEDLAWAMRVSETVAETFLKRLHETGLLDKRGFLFVLHDWHEHQFRSDTSTQRVQRFRQKQRETKRNVSETVQNRTESDTDTDTENMKGIGYLRSPDGDAPPPSKPKTAKKKSPIDEDGFGSDDAAAVACYWNNIAEIHGLPPIRRLTPARRQKAAARLKDAGDLRKLAEIMDSIGHQPFLLGNNDRRWKADFDWFLEPRNFVKVEERKYANGHA